MTVVAGVAVVLTVALLLFIAALVAAKQGVLTVTVRRPAPRKPKEPSDASR